MSAAYPQDLPLNHNRRWPSSVSFRTEPVGYWRRRFGKCRRARRCVTRSGGLICYFRAIAPYSHR